MNSIETDLLEFIKNKDIDFLSDKIELNITFEDYQFNLVAKLGIYEEEYELTIDCTLLKSYRELITLSDDFREDLGEYFSLRIETEEEYLIYCLRMNNCLRDNGIVYSS